MGVSIEKRANTRLHTRFVAAFRANGRQGIGVLSDLSLTGARIRHSTWTPEVGARVELQIEIENERDALEVEGLVVRHADAGFVVGFEKLQESLQRALEEFEISVEDLIDPEALAEPDDSEPAGAALPLDAFSCEELEALAARVAAEIARRLEASSRE